MTPTTPSSQDEVFMRRAIALGENAALTLGTGGPFGCVIVKNDQIIAEGFNCVIRENDPTWHGEMAAIRAAARALGTFDLSGCTLYTSSEPCPMCAGAIHWARISRVLYASTAADARRYGNFDDEEIYRDLAKPPSERTVPLVSCLREEMLPVWKRYEAKPDKTPY